MQIINNTNKKCTRAIALCNAHNAACAANTIATLEFDNVAVRVGFAGTEYTITFANGAFAFANNLQELRAVLAQ